MKHQHVVSIIQRRLTHYRVPFFYALRDSLASVDCSLRLLHGEGTQEERTKQDDGHIAWAEHLKTTYLARGRICWQPFARQVAGSSLVVITQENAMLANHLALLRKPAPKLAFWGHGANLQGDSHSLSERYKRWTTLQADWYFAYSSYSASLVAECGFPPSRTTCLDNAIDLAELQYEIGQVDEPELAALKHKFGLADGPVGLFLGSLYSIKRLSLLLEAAERIQSKIADFQLLVVGAGPQSCEIEAAAKRHSWIKYVGPRKGREKAGALKLATINMSPGAVGLGILDTFAAGLPIVTTDCGLHGPEIAYLSADNGIITQNDLASYVAACTRLLNDDGERIRLATGCRAAADRYTLPNMVKNFTDGVLQALDLPT